MISPTPKIGSTMAKDPLKVVQEIMI